MRTSDASGTASTADAGSSVQDVLPGGPMRSVALLAGLLVLVFACRGGRTTGPEATEATNLEMGPTSVSLAPGDTVQLEATPVNENGNPVSGYEVSWSSADTTVATVDGDGTVTGRSAGSTTVTAAASKKGKGSSSISASVQGNQGKGSDNGKGKKKGLKKQTDVTVTESGLITDLKPVEYEKDTLEAGDSVYVDRAYSIDGVPSEYRGWRYVRTANDDKDATSDSAVTFTLTDTARVALAYDERATTLPDWLRDWTATGDTLRTTDVDHLIYTRVYAPGDVVLGGNRSGGAEGAYSMYVLSATRSDSAPDDTTSSGTDTTSASVDSVDVSPDSATISVGDSTQFSAAVYDSAGNELSRSVSWASSDTTVATVDTDGLATGRDAGSAYVTATADGVSDSARLAVDTTSPGTGALEVITATSGDSLDPDGYTVAVDGGSGQTIGINDTTLYADLTAEDHTVELSGVASNCSLSGSNPRTASVAENDTTPTSFEVNCEASSTSSSSAFREHEPADMTKISENPSDVAEPSGWNLISSNYDIATDSGAPYSPDNIGRWTYPQGSVDSGSLNLGTLTHADFNYDDVYLDIYIKLSSNFQYHSSSTNKMAWFTSLDVSGSNPMYLNANVDSTGEARWTIQLQSPNVPNRTLGQNLGIEYITKGDWYHIEVLLVKNSAGGVADGEAHLWINGTKRGEHTDVEWFSDGSYQFDKFKVNPVWGGQNDTVQETMYMYHDHIYLSGR